MPFQNPLQVQHNDFRGRPTFQPKNKCYSFSLA